MARYIDLENPMVYLGGYTPDGHSVYHVPSNTPTADVVEVVRCKDCKWWKSNFTWNCKEVKVCVKDPFEPAQKEDFFCADGERKSE